MVFRSCLPCTRKINFLVYLRKVLIFNETELLNTVFNPIGELLTVLKEGVKFPGINGLNSVLVGLNAKWLDRSGLKITPKATP